VTLYFMVLIDLHVEILIIVNHLTILFYFLNEEGKWKGRESEWMIDIFVNESVHIIWSMWV